MDHLPQDLEELEVSVVVVVVVESEEEDQVGDMEHQEEEE